MGNSKEKIQHMDCLHCKQVVVRISSVLLLLALLATVVALGSISTRSVLGIAGTAGILCSLFCLFAAHHIGTLLSSPIVLLLGSVAGFVSSDFAGIDYKQRPLGALLGALVGALAWVVIAMNRAGNGESQATTTHRSSRQPFEEVESRPSWRGEPRRWLLISLCVLLLGPVVSTSLWSVWMLVDETVVFAKDGVYYLKAFGAIGAIVGVLMALPFSIAWATRVSSRSQEGPSVDRRSRGHCEAEGKRNGRS